MVQGGVGSRRLFSKGLAVTLATTTLLGWTLLCSVPVHYWSRLVGQLLGSSGCMPCLYLEQAEQSNDQNPPWNPIKCHCNKGALPRTLFFTYET